MFPHRSLLNGEQVHRIYLDELGEIEELPISVALMVLTTVAEDEARQTARNLLKRSNEETSLLSTLTIIEIITTIMVYKFDNFSRQEVESMLGIALEKTRVYREIKEEGREQGQIGEAINLTIRLLTKKFGDIGEEKRSLISGLSLPVVEDLSEALLDFNNLNDLQLWLDNINSSGN
ncbi:DUF2887 domain-containing protein [Anabaena sp. FACHB-1237]|uniref:DUF2887 domain-containing protein n=1 Tax=Anabaena sp. FACHB-1237 TaxID=2692769 RepID=UPI0028C3C1E4|nr:DUF2887 domain-containing protein [Anabaena sp. FACHB-1237]